MMFWFLAIVGVAALSVIGLFVSVLHIIDRFVVKEEE